MKFKHLSTKISWIITPIVFIFLSVFAFAVYGALKHSLLDYVKNDIYLEFQKVQSEIKLDNSNNINREVLNYFFQNVKVIGEFQSTKNEIQFFSNKYSWITNQFMGIPLNRMRKGMEIIHPQTHKHYYLLLAPFLGKEFLFIKDLSAVYHGLHELTFLLVITVPLFIIIINIFLIIIIHQNLRPLRKTIEIAKMITAQNLNRRIQGESEDDEIGQLILTFNQMISRLEKGYNKIYSFAANVAHELRTPLTIISGELELALRDSKDEETRKWLENIYEETLFLKKMIQRLLLLSRLENQLIEPEFYEINFTSVIHKSINRYQKYSNERKIKLFLHNSCEHTLFADPTLLEELVDILLENAIRYSKPGEHIDLDLNCCSDYCEFIISDSCGKIGQFINDEVFKRFKHNGYIRDRKDGGLGIGLSIAHEIVKFHNGSITCNPNYPRGCEFRVRIPLAIYEEDSL